MNIQDVATAVRAALDAADDAIEAARWDRGGDAVWATLMIGRADDMIGDAERAIAAGQWHDADRSIGEAMRLLADRRERLASEVASR